MAMANVDLVCKKCGKSFTFSKNCMSRRAADDCEEWAKSAIDLCPDCRREEENLKEFAEDEKIGLCTLQGTPKQVSWAASLRRKYLKNFLPYFKNRELSIAAVNQESSAEFWIENREHLYDKQLLKSLRMKYRKSIESKEE